MNKNNLNKITIIISILISGSLIGTALAQTQKILQPQEQKMPGDIQYPIKELNNCKSKENCKIFCDDSKNTNACLKFAEKRNLLSPEELAMAKKFANVDMIGPGACKGQIECDKYCGISSNMEECMSFAIKNGMLDQQTQEESQKIVAALKRGVKPPACSGREECDKYCSSSMHMEECINFSIEAGIMDPQKQENSKKVLVAIKRGAQMPACSGKEECDTYCSSAEHMEECVNFSIEAGMMSGQDKERAQKTLEAIKQGIKAPACKGEQECQKYCAEDSHVDECIKFAVATGGMSDKDAQMAIKTRGKGPSGCIGKEECDAFCGNPDNQETCFNFAKENSMIPEEQLQKMQEGQQRMKDTFSQIPQEVLDCITTSLGSDVVEKMKSGSMIPQKSGDTMNQCFQKYLPQKKIPNEQGQGGPGGKNNMSGDMRECIIAQVGEDGLAKMNSENVTDQVFVEKTKICFEKYGQQNTQGGQDGPRNDFQPGTDNINPGGQQMPQQAGPGGCKGPEECKVYCESHQDECKNFKPVAGTKIVPRLDGPGGCKNPEECQAFCSSNPDQCKNSGGEQVPSVNRVERQFASGTQMDQSSQVPVLNRMERQFAPGTQMDQSSPGGESGVRIDGDQVQIRLDGGNFEPNNSNVFQEVRAQFIPQNEPMFPCGELVPIQGQEPGRFIQTEPNRPMPLNDQINQTAPQNQIFPQQPLPPPGGQMMQPQEGTVPVQPPQPPQEPQQPQPTSFVQQFLGAAFGAFVK